MRSALKIIFLGCVLIFFPICPSLSNDLTDDYLDIAQNYYKDGDKGKASEYIERILEIDKNNIPALGLKIKINPPTISKNLSTKEKPAVFDIPYVSCGNSESDNFYNQGLSYYNAKDYMLAEENLKSSIQTTPENYRSYNTLGLVYWAQNKIDDAISAFEKSNSLCKSFTVPLDNLAQIYCQKNQQEKMFEVLNKSINQNPEDYCAYVLLGNYYREINKNKIALEKYGEAIKINPKYHCAYIKISDIKTENLDFSGSNLTLNHYLKINPSDDNAYYLMAKNYINMEDYNSAKASMYKAINLCNCREYREELGKIEYLNEDMEDALNSFNATLNNDTPAEIYNYIGMCYFNVHEFNRAITNINRAISSKNPRVLYYYNLAQVYYVLKDNTNYDRYMDIVKNFKPKTVEDYIDLSGIMLDCDSKNSALAVINKGIEKFPKSKKLYNEKIKIYNYTQDVKNAVQTKIEMETIFK